MDKKRDLAAFLQLVCLFSFIFIVLYFFNGLTGFTIYEAQPDPTAGKDAYIRNQSLLNFGTDTVLKIGKTAAGLESRSLIEFNVSSIPSTDTVVSAVIQVYVSSLNVDNMTIGSYRLTSSWNETETTWDNRSNSTLWSTAGGDYSDTAFDSVLINSSSSWYNFSLRTLVQGWVNGSYANNGVIFIAGNLSGNNNLTEFISSDYTVDSSLRPKITIEHTSNAVPTISNILSDSNLTSIKKAGQSVTFNVTWSDLEGNNAQLFVCRNATINISGCSTSKTFCNTSLASTNPASCSYTIQNSDNRTTNFWAVMCDSSNCSSINATFFHMNHHPNVTIFQPNGGETINQTQGNYNIQFNLSDSDADLLSGGIFYGETANSTTYTINASINMSKICTDADSTTTTTNNCSYSWNSTSAYGNYFLTVLVNDSYHTNNDTSDSSFSVVSLIDTTAPNITSQWSSASSIYSGGNFVIYANVTDPNLRNVWFEVNTTPTQNITMGNTTAMTFNGTLIAPSVGRYQFKVYANDTVGNLNNSLSWVVFNVTKPNANPQNITAPTSAGPYGVIRVTAELNSTDSLRDVDAYLYISNGFVFLSDYNQNTAMGNFSANQTKNVTWFVSTPITTGNYTFNVTFTDYYSNSWNTSNIYTHVSYAGTGSSYSVSVSGYPEVQTGSTYLADAFFRNNGVYENADSVTIRIYDSVGSLIVGPAAMSNPSTGNYNYSYSVGSSVNEGQWQTIVNATKSGVSYYDNEYWHVIGGPFDVRDITIINSSASALQISVVVENTGGANKDITMTWNLTKESNGEVLDSGSDTFAVSANSETNYTISPDAQSFVGQARITFLGYWSGTERAGAYKIFSTTSGSGGGGTGGTGGTGGGGGGGGGGATTQTETEVYDMEIVADTEITASLNIKKTIPVGVKNTGKNTLNNVYLTLQGIDDSYYFITPQIISSLRPGEIETFFVEILAKKVIDTEFLFVAQSDEKLKTLSSRLRALEPEDYFLLEIARLENRISELRGKVDKGELDKCEAIVAKARNSLNAEQFINVADDLEKAEECLEDIEIKEESPKAGINSVWIITWILILLLIAAIVVVIYLLYKKFNVISFMKAEGLSGIMKGKRNFQKKEKKNFDSDMFDKKIEEIEKKLGQE